jgi:MFS family permease
MPDDPNPQPPKIPPTIKARHVAAVVLGNTLEFYDFVTYAFFAIYIGGAFFPSTDPSVSLLASLGAFGAGFITRPVGSIVIGRMGDHLGRKPAMVLSFVLMGIAIVGLALVPSYATIGVAAPMLVIFFRILQGFALGGEVGPTTAILLEAAPLERRGFYTSFQSSSQGVATLAAGLVGFFLAKLLTEQQLQDFGWRIAFLLGAAVVPVGLMLRRGIPETLHAREAASPKTRLRPYLFIAVLGVLMLANGTIGTYIRNYITTYAIATLHMPSDVAFAATVVNGVCTIIFGLWAGVLSDRFGRKPVMLIPSILLLLAIFPGFFVISHYRTTATLLGATALLSILSTISIIPMITWITESLPPAIRSGGVAITYAVSISVFGGTTQYAVAWLIKATGNPLAPAWYWSIAAVVGLAAVIGTNESAPHLTANREHPPA